MKNKENQAFWTAFRLLGPLLFYELCTESVGVACSLFGTQNALTVTRRRGFSGASVSVCSIPEKAGSRGSTEKACAGAEHGSDTAGWQGAVHRSAAAPETSVRRLCMLSSGRHRCMPVPERAFAVSASAVWTGGTAHGRPYTALLWLYRFWWTVVLAPLTEEVLFRGLIRTELRTHHETACGGPSGRPVVWPVSREY